MKERDLQPLGLALIVVPLFFFLALPTLLFQKEKKSLRRPTTLREWFQRESVEGLIELSLEKPFRKALVFAEIRRRDIRDHQRLLEIINSPRYPAKVRIQSFLALVEGKSPLLRQAILAASGTSDETLKNEAFDRLRLLGVREGVERLMELIEQKDLSLWSKTILLNALNQIVQGKTLPPGQLEVGEIQSSLLLWKTWWTKNKSRSPMEWYTDLFEEGDGRRSEKAVELIEKLGMESKRKKAFDTLVKWGLPSPHPGVVIRTLQGLNNLDPQRAFPFLRERALKDSQEEIRYWALLYLKGYRDNGKYPLRPSELIFPVLEKLKDDPSWKVRQQVIKILSEENSPKGLSILLSALKDPHREVQYEAAWSLQQLGRKEGVLVAIRDLENPKYLRRAIVLLRAIFRQSFGLSSETQKYELKIIGRRWKAFLKNKGWLRKETKKKE